MDICPYVTPSTELGSKDYIFMENDKTRMKNGTYITIFSEKFPNQCKNQTNGQVPSNILLLYQASS